MANEMPEPITDSRHPDEERLIEGSRIVKVGRGHYLVFSDTQVDVVYSVDINKHDGLGSCSCDDFLYRRFPRYKSSQIKFDAFRCKHIRRIRNHVLDQIIEFMAEKEIQNHGR